MYLSFNQINVKIELFSTLQGFIHRWTTTSPRFPPRWTLVPLHMFCYYIVFISNKLRNIKHSLPSLGHDSFTQRGPLPESHSAPRRLFLPQFSERILEDIPTFPRISISAPTQSWDESRTCQQSSLPEEALTPATQPISTLDLPWRMRGVEPSQNQQNLSW